MPDPDTTKVSAVSAAVVGIPVVVIVVGVIFVHLVILGSIVFFHKEKEEEIKE